MLVEKRTKFSASTSSEEPGLALLAIKASVLSSQRSTRHGQSYSSSLSVPFGRSATTTCPARSTAVRLRSHAGCVGYAWRRLGCERSRLVGHSVDFCPRRAAIPTSWTRPALTSRDCGNSAGHLVLCLWV